MPKENIQIVSISATEERLKILEKIIKDIYYALDKNSRFDFCKNSGVDLLEVVEMLEYFQSKFKPFPYRAAVPRPTHQTYTPTAPTPQSATQVTIRYLTSEVGLGITENPTIGHNPYIQWQVNWGGFRNLNSDESALERINRERMDAHQRDIRAENEEAATEEGQN